jgi:FkbM family methyltransferase
MRNRYRAYFVVEKLIGRSAAWRIGRWLYAGARRELANDPRVNGEYALQSWVITACLREGDREVVVLDVGANVGNWILSLIQKLSGASLKARICTFEPAPAQCAAIAEKLKGIGANINVTCRLEALSDAPGEGQFQITGAAAGTNSLVPRSDTKREDIVTVQINTVDAVMQREVINHIMLLKIDTEGNDLRVIRGARNAMVRGAIDVIQFEYNWRWLNFGNSMLNVFHVIEGADYVLGRLSNEGIELYERWHPELDRFTETNFVLLSPRLKKHLPARAYMFNRFNVAGRSYPPSAS